MKKLSQLLETFTVPDASEVIIETEGYAVWATWTGNLEDNINNIFQEYGGLVIAEKEDQSLWFFFTSDVLLGLAKMATWVKFHPVSLAVQAFSTNLLVDVHKNLSIQIPVEFRKQSFSAAGSDLITLLDPKLQAAGHNIPGLTYESRKELTKEEIDSYGSIADINWFKLTVDPRLPYISSQGWYAVVHPLGRALDKKFQYGWRSMFSLFEEILIRLKLKYGVHDNYLIVPIDTLPQLREWMRSVIRSSLETKEHDADNYWPCVSAVINRKGLNYSSELPQKVDIDWNELTPDMPYTTYQNAYLLGKEFSIQDMYFTGGTSSINNLCTVTLNNMNFYSAKVPIILPSKLVLGEGAPCFYCGVKSHTSATCPTRGIEEEKPLFWQEYSEISVEDLNLAFRNIEMKLNKAPKGAYNELLKERGLEARALRGVFNVNGVTQLRSVERIWCIMDKNIHSPIKRGSKEESFAWKYLERLIKMSPQELNMFEKEVSTIAHANPRDWRLHCLLGYVAMEKGDYNKAILHWKAAESNTSTLLHQAWLYLLMGRAHEVQGKHLEAIELYEYAAKIMPDWPDPTYRIFVCNIKMNNIEAGKGMIISRIYDRPDQFNRVILDPELERGQLVLLTSLYPQWSESLKHSAAENDNLVYLLEDINDWFPESHPVANDIRRKLEVLFERVSVRNYLAASNVTSQRPILEAELDHLKEYEGQALRDKYKKYLAALEEVRDEASWFPFPGVLTEFNKEFNEAAASLNWAYRANFKDPADYNEARKNTTRLKELLTSLENKLKFIRSVRDSALYGIILTKNFLIFEILFIILATAPVFAFGIYGDNFGFGWVQRAIRQNFWELQSMLLTIGSIAALGFATLRTTVVFDKERDKMLNTAREQHEKLVFEKNKHRIEAENRKKEQQEALKNSGNELLLPQKGAST